MHELLTCAQTRQADGLTIAGGVAGIELMERAGAAVAAVAARMAPPGRTVLVLAGAGNNGGDGFVAARLLREAGFRVVTALHGDAARIQGDAALALARLGETPTPAHDIAPGRFGLIVDALFGAGLDRDVEGEAAAIVEAVNRVGAPVLAIDLPSGVAGDSGQILGTAIRATQTITFFRRKPGHLLYPGRQMCGPVEVAEIGIADDVLTRIGVDTFANEPALWRTALPRTRANTHKYDRGHALVVSGPMPKTGAARLAARSALRAGAGLVTVAAPAEALRVHACHLTAEMLAPCENALDLAEILADRRIASMTIGPGLGRGVWARRMVAAALLADRPTVLDADALTVFADKADELRGLIGRRSSPVVATPHEGEFSGLFPEIGRQRDKLATARSAARQMGAVFLRKGADTVIAHPDGRAAINANAPATLATAGSGDVLAGMIGGLLAQGMAAFEAAAAAVWLHGEAANEIGPGLVADDLPNRLPAVLRQ